MSTSEQAMKDAPTYSERALMRLENDLRANKKIRDLRYDYSLPLGINTPAEARELLQARARSERAK